MTLIATDGKTIAADGLRFSGDTIIMTTAKKLVQRGDAIYAFAGVTSLREPLIEWCEAGADPDKVPKACRQEDDHFSLLKITQDGIYQYTDITPYPDRIYEPEAFGYGREAAMAAMKCGKTPREAIEIACELSTMCGGEITSLPLPCSIEKRSTCLNLGTGVDKRLKAQNTNGCS